MHFRDHFSSLTAQYAAFRPRYPAALFDYLVQVSPAADAAWDCACGSGQATLALAERFASVIATDASAAQIGAAPAHPKVTYRVARAEASGIDGASIDLIIVAQALHWFDLPEFYAEVRRVLRPGGVLAVWTYGAVQQVDPHIDPLIQELYRDILGPWWPPERRLVDEGYRTLDFPFEEWAPPAFSMEHRWSLPQLLGYFRSWSATGRYVAHHGIDPIAAFGERLRRVWGDPQQERTVKWPLSMRIGRMHRHASVDPASEPLELAANDIR